MTAPIPFAALSPVDQAREVDETAARLVSQEVRYCVSGLIHGLQRAASGLTSETMDTLGIDYDDLTRLAYRDPDADDFRDAEDVWVTSGGKCVQAYDVEAGDDGYRWCELEPIILDGEPAERGEWCETALEAWQSLFDDQGFEVPNGSEAFEHWAVTDYFGGRLRDAGETVINDVAGLTIWARCTTGQMIQMDAVIERIARDILGA